jgi:hypothetical protein
MHTPSSAHVRVSDSRNEAQEIVGTSNETVKTYDCRGPLYYEGDSINKPQMEVK